MLSLLKKKSEASAAPLVPPWHPNFRNYEKLPDIKVVRTAFFVNGAAIFIAITLLTYFGFEEWKLRAVNLQIRDLENHITTNKKASSDAVALFGKFKQEEAKVIEVDNFVKSKPVVSEIIIRLAETLPENIALDTLDLRDINMSMRFTVRGEPQVASRRASAYRDQLLADPELAKRFESVEFVSTPTVSASTGRLTVDFILRLKGVGKK
jgi:hypothetical protein